MKRTSIISLMVGMFVGAFAMLRKVGSKKRISSETEMHDGVDVTPIQFETQRLPARHSATTRTSTGGAGYQTEPLGVYRTEFFSLAEEVFDFIRSQIGDKFCKQEKGSYSLRDRGGMTIAKVVIIQHGIGRIHGGMEFE